MKTKIFILFASIVCLVSCRDGLWNAINELNDKYENLDGRVAKLEEKCKEMNTNISSLQTLVSVILNNDYIVSITPIMKENQKIGYTITFAIHEPITIYHGQNGADGKDGQNGKDGENGKDGKDGVTPIIGVAQDETDHAYYWTLNGTWLLDANGNRVPLTSKDGKDGQDGKPGQNGQDGKDGKDGTTPQLKIENGYWYVSTDSGTTWTQLGKAVGENGQDGKDGKDGADGDSMFSSVTQDENFVYFELANGTILTVSKYKDDSVQIIDGAIMAEFSVSDTKKVYFSMGDLQFSTEGTHLCKDGETREGTWRFNPTPYDNSMEEGWNTTFLWASSGGSCNPSTGAWIDWGYFNAISNGGNTPDIWRTLKSSEWQYLISRNNGSKWLPINFVDQNNTISLVIVIFPDNYYPSFSITHYRMEDFLPYVSYETWHEWAKHGAIFLRNGIYWTSDRAYGSQIRWNYIRYYSSYESSTLMRDLFGVESTDRFTNLYYGVRLVKDVQ